MTSSRGRRPRAPADLARSFQITSIYRDFTIPNVPWR
jgi:hypothetical protein